MQNTFIFLRCKKNMQEIENIFDGYATPRIAGIVTMASNDRCPEDPSGGKSEEKKRRRPGPPPVQRLLRVRAIRHLFRLTPFTLLLRPCFLLLGSHHRPNLPARVHLDLLQLLLALVVGQRGVFLQGLELILGVFADRFDFVLLLVGQVQGGIVLWRVRIHPATSAVAAGACSGRRRTWRSRRPTLLGGSRKRNTANKSERAKNQNQFIYFHKHPSRAKWSTRTFCHEFPAGHILNKNRNPRAMLVDA